MSLTAPLRALLLAAGAGYLPEQASTVAAGVDQVFFFLFWLSAFFLALIVGLSAWFVVRYRRTAARPAPEASPDHSTGLELFWSVIPLLLVIGVFVASTQVYLAMTSAPGGPPAHQVKVVARKWSWSFEYQGGRKDRDLHLVAGQPVELTLASVDVIHSLYVPQFRLKQDAVPGRYTKMIFTPSKAGSWPIVCTEYCGTNHSQMNAVAVVHPDQADYDAWARAGAAAAGELSLVDLGKKVFLDQCSACHEVEPEDPKKEKGIGPTLHGLWGREETLNGGAKVKVDENYLRESIVKPGAKIVAGYEDLMSPFALEERELLGVIAYIQSLGAGAKEAHERDEHDRKERKE